MKLKLIVVAIAHVYARRAGLSLGALALVVEKIETITDAATRTLYKEKDGKWHLDVTGLPEPEDTAGLKTALQKERDQRAKDAKTIKDLNDKFTGIDPDEVRRMLATLDNDEDAKLLAKGADGMKVLVEKKTQKAIEAANKLVKDAEAKVLASEGKTKTLIGKAIDNFVRAVVTKAGVHTSAIDDALMRARGLFSLSEDGEGVVQLDKDGSTVMGKDGKTPFSVADWIETMKETAPHWFPANGTGSGARNDGKGNNPKGLKRAEFDALTPADRVKWVKDNPGVKIAD